MKVHLGLATRFAVDHLAKLASKDSLLLLLLLLLQALWLLDVLMVPSSLMELVT